MLTVTHWLLTGTYVLLPIAALALAIWRMLRHRAAMLVQLVLIAVAAIGLGAFVMLSTARLLKGATSASEFVRLVYLLIGVLCLLWLIDRAMLWGIFRVLRVRVDARGLPVGRRKRALLGLILQRLALLSLMMPYMLALVAIYRPRLIYTQTPADLKLAYDLVDLRTEDGVDLRGWWIAPPPHRSLSRDARWGRQTVILCHGLASSKARHLSWAEAFVERGYNVLLLDLRAHGQSGGYLTSFGANEKLDVLAALRWIRQWHPDESERVFGVGANMGAIAVLGAAADPAGSAIDAIALYEPYSDVDMLARYNAGRAFPRPVNWLVSNIGVPLAKAHVGIDFASPRPTELVQRIWPRPVLIVHGRGHTLVPVTQEMPLYQAALQPKAEFWPADNYEQLRAGTRTTMVSEFVHLLRQILGTEQSITDDFGCQQRTIRFLDEAQSVPVL